MTVALLLKTNMKFESSTCPVMVILIASVIQLAVETLLIITTTSPQKV